jgi:hypothetical protein
MSEYVVTPVNRRSKYPYAQHVGLSAADSRELAHVYVLLGHAPKDVHVVVDAAQPARKAA